MVVQYEDMKRFKEREEKTDLSGNMEEGQIKPNPFFYTPTSVEELTNQINSYNGPERAAAWMGAMLAWNFAALWVNKK